ncbi:unnamed protein product [Sphagnum balticum]
MRQSRLNRQSKGQHWHPVAQKRLNRHDSGTECFNMSKNIRKSKGSIFVLVSLTTCILLVPALIIFTQCGLYWTYKERALNVVEAASLIAANDLSRIIINDDHFGYVSLSNYPPTGKGTCARDGEPMPVIGINTLIGTVRQNTILASEIQNDNLASIVDNDYLWLNATIANLNATLKSATSANDKQIYYDVQGNKVEIYKDVSRFLVKNLPANLRLESVKITTGWLSTYPTTTIPIPQPERLSQTKKEDTLLGKYRAFRNIPASRKDFSFAAIGSATTLLTPHEFQEADNRHINSIIKVECTIAPNDLLAPVAALGMKPDSIFNCIACSQPLSLPDAGPKGLMTLRFTVGPLPGLNCWNDLLTSSNFQDRNITRYDAIYGDYPTDREARLIQSCSESQTSTAQQFTEHLYSWLRNGQVRPKLDAVISMLTQPFLLRAGEIYAYEFGKDGMISRRILARDPFPIGITSDGQSMVIADTTTREGFSPIVVFRNHAQQIGTVYGGKHGGQPLAGAPLNWCELAEFGGDEQMAFNLGKGRLGTLLSVFDNCGSTQSINNVVEAGYNPFKSLSGNSLQYQTRRSFYSGGLVVDIEVGGTLPSTAANDMESMKHLKFARRI